MLSLSGLCGFSAATSFLIRARIAVEEHSPPAVVATWLEKKYLSSNMPLGVCIYLLVVARDMVDSCISTASAMSCNTSGFMASAPYSRKFFWCSTIRLETLSKVSLRLCRLFKNQRASCRLSRRKVLSELLSARLKSLHQSLLKLIIF